MKLSDYKVMVIGPYPPNALLRDTFSTVSSVDTVKEALTRLQQQQQDTTINNNNNDTNPSTLLLIDTENEHRNILLLKMIIYHLRHVYLGNVIPLVCCFNDSPNYMMTCINHGAAGYLLKPLRQNVIQTMFLHAHRYSPPIQVPPPPSPTLSISTPSMDSTFVSKVDPHWHHNNQRYHQIRQLFHQHDRLYRSVLDSYAVRQSRKPCDVAILSRHHKNELANRVCQWNFNPYDLDDIELIYCVSWIFDQVFQLPDLAAYKLSQERMDQFIQELHDGYLNTNAYHSFCHAVDVLQAMYYTLCHMDLLHQPKISPSITQKTLYVKQLLGPIGIFALLMICVSHDLGHPGVTNTFMINTSTSLSLIYNDVSVLESLHATLFCHLFQKYWPTHLQDKNDDLFRKLVIQGILATDMAMHQEYMTKFMQLEKTLYSQEQPPMNDDDQRILICAALIKCADISNIARPFSVAKVWAQRLVEELHFQSEMEAELDLPSLYTSFGIPLDEDGRLPLPPFQKQFISRVGINLFEATNNLVSGLDDWICIAKRNMTLWNLEQQ
ncbi:uncharacterized protein BX664DRAFT_273555 [Halteromyces radiatus]|uniref:uncharacterized protein n=1 Tax=Halteromyces radiatus TaxID=101107 RepID=UPI00221F345F|nr:uncharacterized protein BX664DRAFT_273555 [Halteromyces radiatus]KAI8099973.1 hypothetical protein BX664DRAFT_273555 [Halteromyces radiatus]